MPEPPILILLPSPGPPDPAAIERGPDGDPMVLGLSLIQRTVLAAQRAGYRRRSFSSGEWAQLGRRMPCRVAAPLILAPATILAEADWLERLASIHIEPAAWAAIPGRIVMLPAVSAPAAADALNEDGGARDLKAAESRLARLFGPPAPIPAQIDPMVVETPADVRAAERRLLTFAGQGHGRVHGAPCRAADLACDFAPPRGNRDHAQSDEPDFDCGRDLRRPFFPVLAPADANDRGAPVSRPFDPRRLRRGTGEAQIPAIAMGRNPRFLGRQRRSHRHFRLHGRRLEPGRGLALAARARRRRRSRDAWARRASSIGA